MEHIWIEEEYTGEDVDKETGEVLWFTEYVSPVYETFATNPKQLFDALQREHGRCLGYLLQDENGVEKKIGWVFKEKAYYEDTHEPYIRTVSVTVVTPEKYPVRVTRMMHKPVEIA